MLFADFIGYLVGLKTVESFKHFFLVVVSLESLQFLKFLLLVAQVLKDLFIVLGLVHRLTSFTLCFLLFKCGILKLFVFGDWWCTCAESFSAGHVAVQMRVHGRFQHISHGAVALLRLAFLGLMLSTLGREILHLGP